MRAYSQLFLPFLGLLTILALHMELTQAAPKPKTIAKKKAKGQKVPPGWKKNFGQTEAELNRALINLDKFRRKIVKKKNKDFKGNKKYPTAPTIGDIAFTGDQSQMLLDNLQRRRKRKVIDVDNAPRYSKWPAGKKIKYVITDDNSPHQAALIRAGIFYWENRVRCIKFQHVPLADEASIPNSETYLRFIQNMGCWSYVGKVFTGTAQPISIMNWCFDYIGYVAHEIGHAIGLLHEHQRADRNQYLAINFDAMETYYIASFNIFPSQLTLNIPYDYGSVMMYASTVAAFTGSGLKTIITKDIRHQQTLGQPVEISYWDSMAVDAYYCPACTGPSVANCQHGGYPDPVACSVCICPDGFTGVLCDGIIAGDSGAGWPVGGVVPVTSQSYRCLTSSGYDAGGRYIIGTEINWFLMAPSAAFTIETQFIGRFGVQCKDSSETCLHWVEIQYEPGLKRGFRFCCNMSPNRLFTNKKEMFILFNAKFKEIPIDVPHDYQYRSGFKLCYRLQEQYVPCRPNLCQNSGSCVLNNTKPFGYRCNCANGYHGSVCEIPPTACQPNPCLSGGTCTLNANSYTCTCLPGFSGRNCQLTPCNSGPCLNGGTCNLVSSSNTGYECMCPSGYSGTTCQNLINPCTGNPCGLGTCTPSGTSAYTCICPTGYNGVSCEKDPCHTHPCINSGTCAVDPTTSTGYTCTCKPGYTGLRCGNDPCSTSQCQNSGTCVVAARTTGGYRCDCPAGYTGYNCQDDPCTPSQCQNSATCIVDSTRVSGYSCTCPNGFTGNNCATGPCTANPCLNQGTCNRDPTSATGYVCQCATGYSGPTCQHSRECDSLPCQNGGQCVELASGYFCLCTASYYGTNCELFNNCHSQPCLNGASCFDANNTFHCKCTPQHHGRTCDKINHCATNPCAAGETCEDRPNGHHCWSA